MLSFWISLASVTKALPSFPVSTQFVFIKSPAGRFGSYDSLFYSLVSYRNFGHRKTVRNLPKFLVSSISTWGPKEHEFLERGVTVPERVGTGTRYPFRHFVCLFVCLSFLLLSEPCKIFARGLCKSQTAHLVLLWTWMRKTKQVRKSSPGFVMTGLDFRLANCHLPGLKFHSVFCHCEG